MIVYDFDRYIKGKIDMKILLSGSHGLVGTALKRSS